ncbi:hypothetical protein [Roseateles amylovorans]|uniref:TonB-dependent receptor plug domain-containing protein n=1 Tax=Roseateles amylovorans TaxID=2978473 RepID=A0ABY6AYB0_9BURK|nr:hypothetical protein [Roseateles amylovorans]UXH78164.1 hypothetical protein N4261_24970 [Roseateles amylovorans]
MNTHFNTTSFKAFAFGIGATLALAMSFTHLQAQRDLRASIVTLEPVVITAKRADLIKQLPTVYVTGRRAAQPGDAQFASAQIACAIQLC